MPTNKWKTSDGKERESRVVSNYELPKSNGLVDADGKRWYNSINPGIDTSVGSAIMFGPGIVSRLITGGWDREEAMPFEEQLWEAYTTGNTGDLIKPSKYRFEGDGDNDAQYIQVPQEQALLIQAIADQALVYGRGIKARSLDHPELIGYESSRRNVKEDLGVAKAIMENPGEWIQVNEGNSPMAYKKKTKDGKDSFNYSGLGGFKNFAIRWIPEEGYLEVKDDYDFRSSGIEGIIPRRDIPIKIRDRIKFDPKKGSVLRNNPSALEDKGYIQRYGLSDKDIKDGVSEYEKDPNSTYSSLIEKFDDGGEVDGGFDECGLVEKQDHIYERLTDEYDIPPLQAVAIVANLTHESGLRDDALGDSGVSFGIQQWKGDRRKKLESFAKSRYHEVPTLDDQVDFLMGEYSTNAFQFKNQGKNLYASGVVSNPIFDYYQYSKYDFDNASNLYDATIAWNQGVGRPNKKYAYNERRYEIAKGIAERHGVDIGGDSHYTEMGYNVLPDLLVQAPSKSSQPAADIPSQKEREDKYMAEYGNGMLADLLSYGSGNINIHVVNPQIPSQNISGDEAAEMKRLELQNRREQQKRLLEAVLPNIGLNIPNLSK